jgi:hypothetical protein
VAFCCASRRRPPPKKNIKDILKMKNEKGRKTKKGRKRERKKESPSRNWLKI